ncbi:MAG TPA: histidine kinase [Longimicrobiaceae bacterium]|nr:histidine kinase [Longimicrobiaceae bacterium]
MNVSTTISAPPARGRTWPTRTETLLVFGVWTLIALLLASSSYLSAAVEGRRKLMEHAATMSAADSYSWAVVTLVALWASRRLPIERDHLGLHLFLTAAIGLVLVVARASAIRAIIESLQLFPPRPLPQVILSFAAPNYVTFWMLVGVAHALEYAKRFRERAMRSAHLEAQLARTQVQMLKMQLHPHFLFNTLHAISTLVHHDPNAAEQTIASLSELLRSTLAHEQAQEVTVAEEMALLEPYLEIEKIRLGERLRLNIEVEPETREAFMPHFLLQPLVENSIRHGIAPRRQGGRVEIRVERAGRSLRVSVSDDGCGFPAGGNGSGGGVGLTNTRARLEQLYHGGQRFDVRSEPDAGTQVVIDLPFHLAAAAEPSVRS